MALAELKFFSTALQMQTSIYVCIPKRENTGEIGTENNSMDGDYKCLYLLHGLSDDNSIWLRRTSIERYAEQYGICVVMPSADRSFYTDQKYGGQYYTYIAKELPQVVQEFFHVSSKREDNYIAGLSMGGYGALKIALRESDRFCAAAGLSAVADVKEFYDMPEYAGLKNPILGEGAELPPEEDLFYLIEANKDNPLRPRIFQGVGTEDFLYGGNTRFREKMEALPYDYTYQESKGIHNWEFWDEYIQYALKWMFEA